MFAIKLDTWHMISAMEHGFSMIYGVKHVKGVSRNGIIQLTYTIRAEGKMPPRAKLFTECTIILTQALDSSTF